MKKVKIIKKSLSRFTNHNLNEEVDMYDISEITKMDNVNKSHLNGLIQTSQHNSCIGFVHSSISSSIHPNFIYVTCEEIEIIN